MSSSPLLEDFFADYGLHEVQLNLQSPARPEGLQPVHSLTTQEHHSDLATAQSSLQADDQEAELEEAEFQEAELEEAELEEVEGEEDEGEEDEFEGAEFEETELEEAELKEAEFQEAELEEAEFEEAEFEGAESEEAEEDQDADDQEAVDGHEDQEEMFDSCDMSAYPLVVSTQLTCHPSLKSNQEKFFQVYMDNCTLRGSARAAAIYLPDFRSLFEERSSLSEKLTKDYLDQRLFVSTLDYSNSKLKPEDFLARHTALDLAYNTPIYSAIIHFFEIVDYISTIACS
jgi:hypothetical protein